MECMDVEVEAYSLSCRFKIEDGFVWIFSRI